MVGISDLLIKAAIHGVIDVTFRDYIIVHELRETLASDATRVFRLTEQGEPHGRREGTGGTRAHTRCRKQRMDAYCNGGAGRKVTNRDPCSSISKRFSMRHREVRLIPRISAAPCPVSTSAKQNLDDMGTAHLSEGIIIFVHTPVRSVITEPHFRRQALYAYGITVFHEQGTFDGVLQFSHIPGPLVAFEARERFLRNTADHRVVLLGVFSL